VCMLCAPRMREFVRGLRVGVIYVCAMSACDYLQVLCVCVISSLYVGHCLVSSMWCVHGCDLTCVLLSVFFYACCVCSACDVCPLRVFCPRFVYVCVLHTFLCPFSGTCVFV
jgi:hypothetical protein